MSSRIQRRSSSRSSVDHQEKAAGRKEQIGSPHHQTKLRNPKQLPANHQAVAAIAAAVAAAAGQPPRDGCQIPQHFLVPWAHAADPECLEAGHQGRGSGPRGQGCTGETQRRSAFPGRGSATGSSNTHTHTTVFDVHRCLCPPATRS